MNIIYLFIEQNKTFANILSAQENLKSYYAKSVFYDNCPPRFTAKYSLRIVQKISSERYFFQTVILIIGDFLNNQKAKKNSELNLTGRRIRTQENITLNLNSLILTLKTF